MLAPGLARKLHFCPMYRMGISVRSWDDGQFVSSPHPLIRHGMGGFQNFVHDLVFHGRAFYCYGGFALLLSNSNARVVKGGRREKKRGKKQALLTSLQSSIRFLRPNDVIQNDRRPDWTCLPVRAT